MFAFSFTSQNVNTDSDHHLLFHKLKKEVPVVYNELEDNEEETDFLPIFTFHSFDFFSLDAVIGESSTVSLSEEQTNSLSDHLPLWLATRHIIQ